jgi:hypothetical protein
MLPPESQRRFLINLGTARAVLFSFEHERLAPDGPVAAVEAPEEDAETGGAECHQAEAVRNAAEEQVANAEE